MGLQCSKQGHIGDFHSYDGNDRVGPEGECFPSKLDNRKGVNLNLMTQEMKNIILALESHNNSALPAQDQCKRENVLVGEESCTFQESKLVNLPPEGKVDSDKEFVELPTEHASKKISNDGCYVALPPDQTDIIRAESKDSLDSNSKFEKERSDQSTPNENAWSYTLYDFQGKEMVTKKDLKQLMESICNVIGQTPCDIAKKKLKSHSLNSQDESTLDNNSRTGNIKSPCKYTPSKQYKGMIFPPPNTEEAEKVSCYIEEKLTAHNHGEKSHRRNHLSRELRRRAERTTEKSFSERTCKCPVLNNLKNEQLFVIPKRKGVCGNDVRTLMNGTVITNHDKVLPKSNSSFSPVSMSGSNTPQSIDEINENDVIIHRKVPTSVKTRSHLDDNFRIRLRHTCSCHQRIKDKLKPLQLNSIVDQESNLCKHIKTAHRETHEYDDLSLHSSNKSTSCSTTSSSESSRVGCTRKTSKKNRKHDDTSSLSKSRHKCVNDESETDQRSKPKCLNNDEILLSTSKQKLSDDDTSYSSRNASKQIDTRSINNLSSSQRPAVWPGECIKNEPSEEISPSLIQFESEPAEKLKISELKSSTTEHLCFCKRMLGLDYPCNHGNTVHHTHKHEHHHYHYYVHQSSS